MVQLAHDYLDVDDVVGPESGDRCRSNVVDAQGDTIQRRFSFRPPRCASIASRLGSEPEIRFFGDLASGNLITEPVAASDWLRIAELASAYRELPLGTVDASVVAAGERLQISPLATLDHRHLAVVRPAHVDAFEILP
jgi:hypothetical protein